MPTQTEAVVVVANQIKENVEAIIEKSFGDQGSEAAANIQHIIDVGVAEIVSHAPSSGEIQAEDLI